MDTRYPDGMYQLTQLFDSERTGDVVVSATPGYDLRRDHESPEHFGSHGSLHRDHMHVPIACSAPLTEGPMRTIDVFPSTLQHMAMAQTTPIDGISRAGC
jgi:hypothetical protein